MIVTGFPVPATLFKSAPYRIAIMNEDIGKLGYKKTSLRTFKVTFLTCNSHVCKQGENSSEAKAAAV